MAEDRCDLLCLDLPHAEEVRHVVPSPDDVQKPADRARAMADPTRLRLAAALAAGGELCVCDLAWVAGLAQNLVSHHVRVLRSAGLAASRRDGRLVMYRLTPQGTELLRVLLGSGGHSEPVLPAQSAAPEAARRTPVLDREGS